MHCERRLAGRHRVTFSVICDGETRYTQGKVTDLSESGLFVESSRLLPMGTAVFLTPIGRATEHLFEIPAKVVRLEAAGMGLRLGSMDDDDRHGLQRLIREMPQTLSETRDGSRLYVGGYDERELEAPSRARVHGGTRGARAWVRLKSAVRLWD